MGSNSAVVTFSCGENLEGTLSRYLPALYRMALRQLGNHEDAEDAVQDALLSAFTHISQFDGRSHISTWLHRIVINSARMQLRRRQGRTFLSLDEGEDGNSDLEHQLIDSGLSPQQTCEKAELRAIVQQLLKQLSPELRKALELRQIDGLSTDESARALGVTRGTLKSRVHRARAKLGMLLAHDNKADVMTRNPGHVRTREHSNSEGAEPRQAGAKNEKNPSVSKCGS